MRCFSSAEVVSCTERRWGKLSKWMWNTALIKSEQTDMSEQKNAAFPRREMKLCSGWNSKCRLWILTLCFNSFLPLSAVKTKDDPSSLKGFGHWFTGSFWQPFIFFCVHNNLFVCVFVFFCCLLAHSDDTCIMTQFQNEIINKIAFLKSHKCAAGSASVWLRARGFWFSGSLCCGFLPPHSLCSDSADNCARMQLALLHSLDWKGIMW